MVPAGPGPQSQDPLSDLVVRLVLLYFGDPAVQLIRRRPRIRPSALTARPDRGPQHRLLNPAVRPLRLLRDLLLALEVRGPCGPGGPTAPGSPFTPCCPTGPGSPFAPCGPTGPMAPASPFAPSWPDDADRASIAGGALRPSWSISARIALRSRRAHSARIAFEASRSFRSPGPCVSLRSLGSNSPRLVLVHPWSGRPGDPLRPSRSGSALDRPCLP